MKRISKLLFAILFMVLAFAVVGCKKNNNTDNPDEKTPTIAFAQTSLEVTVGDTFRLNPTITNLENGAVDFSFDKPGIVSFANNTFTAEAEGVVVVTATLQGYSDIKASVTVTVVGIPEVKVTGITVNGQAEMDEGGNQTLVALVSPDNATNKDVDWASSDATIASVGTNGMVNALKAGTVKITATAKDGSNVKGEIQITVNATNVPVTTVSFTANEKMYVDKTQQLTAVVLPTNATTKTVTWKAEPTSVATVDSKGLVTAIAPGKVKITATANDGSNIFCEKEITVLEFVKPEYTAVNPEWEFEEFGTTVTLFGKDYEFGYSAYASLDDGINAATKGTYVAPGNYPDDASIAATDFALIGPNAAVDPNKVNRTDEAVITGTITIKSGSKNITIKGFAFTSYGCVDAEDEFDGIEISFNNVYDTNTDVAAWTEGRQEAEAVFDFWVAKNGLDSKGKETLSKSQNVVIKNNKFSNITEAGIMVARVKNVTVTDNSFYNFKKDAVRGEGGYNHGDWLFENNKFINDEVSGNNGIYLQAVSGIEDTTYQKIIITNNTFKNIGDSTSKSSYNCAISIRTYQEKGLTLEITYNNFENCVNYLNLRNNGATSATFTGIISYNRFKGVPSGVYHRNIRPGSDDTATSNPPLTIMDYNLFLDSEGAVLADLSQFADKFLDLSDQSNKNNYATKEEYEEMIRSLGGDFDIVVNTEWSALAENAEVEYENLTYKMGETAFASISEAVAKATEGQKIMVLAGVYDEKLKVEKNNITLLGPNYNIFAGNTNRNAEAQLSNVITLGANNEGFTLNGFEVTGAFQLSIPECASNTSFVYNVINAPSADGTIRVEPTTNNIATDLNVSYNYSNNHVANRFLWISNVNGLTLSNNELSNERQAAFDFVNVQGYIKGKVDIIGNTYIGAQQSFIYVVSVGQINATIEGNHVENIKNTAIDIRGMIDNEDGDNTFDIQYNTFINAGCGWCPIRIRTSHDDSTGAILSKYDENDSITVSIQNNKFIDSYYNNNSQCEFIENPSINKMSDPFKKIYTIGKNYYSVSGNPYTELTDANFCGAAISFDTAYATEADCPAYVKVDEILPTSITISNKVEKIDAFTSLQLKFIVNPDNATNKKVGFKSSNPKAATVTSAGLVNALSGGTTTITVFAMADNTILDSFTLEVKPVERIELRYEGNGVLAAGETLDIEATYIGESTDAITYESSNTDIATVDATGKVTAVAKGEVTITAKVGEVSATLGLSVLDNSELNDLLKLLVANNNGVVMDETFKYIGSDDGSADYEHEIYGSVNNYFAGKLPSVEKNMLDLSTNHKAGGNGNDEMKSLEWIVIHDTAGSGSTSTARANSGWCTNPQNNPDTSASSWHYTIGNDGIFQQMEENIIAWHAGDGTSWATADVNYSTTWHDTGVAY
ncbi:MAG: Ig-like domain-containing protein, partial [Bacilli bacterium]|nr:Ig-like domain-containing protein [Bacilli bacterium]